jgi:P-type Cu+ transporter
VVEENKTKKDQKKTEVKIAGMTCANCATTIERSLKSLNGVTNANVNVGTETAAIEYDSEKVTLAEIQKAVTDVGYKVMNEKIVINIRGMTCAMCVIIIDVNSKTAAPKI